MSLPMVPIMNANASHTERRSKIVEDRYSASTKSHTYQTSAREHLTEVIDKSDSNYIRCTYSFDKTGRPTGQINYDSSGKILGKSTVERLDSSENWIEKKIIVWDTMSEQVTWRRELSVKFLGSALSPSVD